MEGLAKYRALVYVSGHDSAWGPYSDFFDRFSQYKPITLRKWTGEDILKLVTARAPYATPASFGPAQAEHVAALTSGNVRRVVSMCRVLFRETSGFDRQVSAEDVVRVAEQIGQTISIGEATERVREIAESAGLKVEAGGVLETKETNPKKLQFDLVGFRANQPRLVVELKHAFDQRLMVDKARRFIVQMAEVGGSYPEVVGCFIVDGNVDDEVLKVLRSDQRLRILSFDLTQRDAINLIERDLASRLRDGRDISPEAARLKELQDKNKNIEGRIEGARRDDNQKLIRQLQRERKALEAPVSDLRAQLGTSSRELEKELTAIEQRRKAELEDLYARLEQLSKQISSQRDVEIVAPQQEEVTARLQTTYTDLTKPLPLSTKLRLALGNPNAGIGVVSAILGFILFSVAPELADYTIPFRRTYDGVEYRPESYLPYKYFLHSVSFMLMLLGVFLVWRRFTQTEAYLDYSTRLLREVYLQSPNPMELVRVSNILRDSLEERGPVHGKRRANERLAEELPYFFSYLATRAERENISKAEAKSS